MKTPWFRIIEVVEPPHGLSLADIARQVAAKHQVSLEELRGNRCDRRSTAARLELYVRVKRERNDLTSSQVARFMRKCSSTIRHAWRTYGDVA